MKLTAIAIAAVLLALGTAPGEAQTVYIEARGTVTAAPDIATISVGVSARAETPETTIAASAKTVNALLAMLAEEGIAPRDIQTRRYEFGEDTARPNYNAETEYLPEEKVIGYHLDNTVEVRVRDLPSMGTLIAKIIRVGATSIGQITFAVEDDLDLYDQARAEAYARAEVKAQIYAKAAHRTLGELSYIREGVGYDAEQMVQIAYPFGEGNTDLGYYTEVEAGELEFTVAVTSVWSLGPPL